jgi:opacity protein-like surface antigen
MEKRVPRFLLRICVPALVLLACHPAAAQLVVGQYEDEAPLRTWNTFGIPSAPSIGLGGTQFARASDSSVSLVNPALLVSLPRYSVTLTGSWAWASMFKYSLVNTGVVSSPGNLTAGSLGVEFGGLSLRAGSWAFSASAGILENYGRPGISLQDPSLTYSLDMSQSGFLRDYHFAAARRIGPNFSAGLGITYVTGRRRRSILETSAVQFGRVTITDDKSENENGVFLNGGIAWEPTGRLTAALVFRSSYIQKADARSSLRYEAPTGDTDIQIDAAARNEYRQPWIFGAGVSYRFSDAWAMAADLAYFGWSRYSATFFDEPLDRQFRDVLKAGAGVEYLATATLFGRPGRVPVRLGLSYDPQPMTGPRSAYVSVSLGAGLQVSSIAIDLSGSVGRESGSGNSLTAGKIALTFTYIFDR